MSPCSFRLLSWNVDGLYSKFDYPEFFHYLTSFSVVCLFETFTEAVVLPACLQMFVGYFSPAKKLSLKGRMSGGLLCLVKRDIADLFQQIHCAADNVLVFRVDKSLFNNVRDVLLILAYIPPYGSPYYATMEIGDGTDFFEQTIAELTVEHDDCGILICGDLNARTASFNTDCNGDMSAMFSEVLDDSRLSSDIHINDFGRSLLTLCSAYNLTILNGLFGENSGRFTYVSATGSSVIDYCIVSKDLLHRFTALQVSETILSCHMCLVLSTTALSRDGQGEDDSPYEKVVWDSNRTKEYLEHLQDLLAVNSVDDLFDEDVNSSHVANVLSQCLMKAADFLKRTFRSKKQTQGRDWFDADCANVKRITKKLLRTYLKTKHEVDRQSYIDLRRKYKEMIRIKKSDYRAAVGASLCSNIRNSSEFWKNVKKLNSANVMPNVLSSQSWYEHSSKLLICNDIQPISSLVTTRPVRDFPFDEELNGPITKTEIEGALKHLATGKAGGIDGITTDMLKSSQHIMLPYFLRFFNMILNSGIYPEIWRNAIIVPIYKGGLLDNPDNYRGIALTSSFSKVFTHIINERLKSWAEEHDLIREEQAGFRKGYGTVDNIFVLQGIIGRYLGKRKKLYVGFVDFKKAFDTVKRPILWSILENNGIKGRLLNIIKSMYNKVQYCVRAGQGYSDSFESNTGLKQGCKISPILFSFLINSLIEEISCNSKHGIQLSPNTSDLSALLFADDVALLADSAVGLQNQFNQLKKVADRLGLVVNGSKTKVVVYRLGGHLAKHEKWHYGDTELETVSEYKYLGNVLSTKLSSISLQTDIAYRAKAAFMVVLRALRKLSHITPNVFFKLFDAQIQPMLLYGSEVWGIEECQTIEKVHLFALKRFLNVADRTPNIMVYGDTGRFPLYINAHVRSVKYWLKILRMEESRLPRRVYNMMLSLSEHKWLWTAKVERLLKECGLEKYWLEQQVNDETNFLRDLRNKLVSNFYEDWKKNVLSSNRYAFYRQIKSSWGVEQYLYDIDRKVFRDIFVRFRMGITELYVHKFRYDLGGVQRLCPLCREEIETELHFLIRCPALSDLRVQCLPSVIWTDGNIFELMSSNKMKVIRSISIFMYRAFVRRQDAIDSVECDSFYFD